MRLLITIFKSTIMKATQQIPRLFTCFILFSLMLTINGCSSDDNSCTTFLECQDGTIWEGQIDIFMYFKVNNNKNNPIEVYLPEGDCYYYSPISESNFVIMENSKNTLKIKIMDDSDGSFEVITFSISNEVLSVREVYTENGIEDIDTGTFSKSIKNLNSVAICN